MKKEVIIVTGEASGDLHGANLVRAMRRGDDNLLFCGMGGDELAACGMEILCDAAKVAVVGIVAMMICWLSPPAFLLGSYFTAHRWRRARVMRCRISSIRRVPSRHGMHLPQLSLWMNDM